MLTETFRIFKGIGIKTEQKLWNAGYKDWNSILTGKNDGIINKSLWSSLKTEIKSMNDAIESKNYESLKRNLDTATEWRAIPEFMGRIAYLDVLSTGKNKEKDKIITISVCDGYYIFNFVKGFNLGGFPDFIQNFPAIATYYGKTKVIPFIENNLEIEMNQIHFDLGYILRKVRLIGGLKKIEKTLHISRANMEDINDECARFLWNKYRNTNKSEYIDTILAYSTENAYYLEKLLISAYNLLLKKQNLHFDKLEFPKFKVRKQFEINLDVIKEFLDYKKSKKHIEIEPEEDFDEDGWEILY